jgi:type I restriction enzyme S subunit
VSWEPQLLGEHVDILSGFAFRSEKFNTENVGIPIIRIRDVVAGTTSTYYDGPYDPEYVVGEGDILIGMDGEFNCARWKGDRSLLNQRVCRIASKNGTVDEGYLFRFLPRALKEIEHRTPFVTVKHLSVKDIRAIKIPIPPLDEQQRIGAILDQADDLRHKRLETLASLDRLSIAYFRSMFSSENWKCASLGSLCELVRGSSPRPQGDPRYFGGPIPRLMIADITRDGMWVTPCIDSLTAEGAKRSRPMIAGAVVMAVSGAVGLPAILAVDACIHDGFVGFRNLDAQLTNIYLYYWLLSNRAAHRASGTGAIWVNLTTDQVSLFSVPVPGLDVQRAFAARVAKIDELRGHYRAHLAKLDALFASLQHRAFRGEL